MRISTLLLWALLCCGAAPALALENGEQFNHWTARCLSADDRGGNRAENGGKDTCHIVQRLVVEKHDDNEIAVQMSVGISHDESVPVAIIRMPLGLWLVNGITLTVDNNQSQRFPVQMCASAGCQTTLRMEPDLVETLQAGKRLIITTYNVRQQPVQIPIDLEGFGEALKALRENL